MGRSMSLHDFYYRRLDGFIKEQSNANRNIRWNNSYSTYWNTDTLVGIRYVLGVLCSTFGMAYSQCVLELFVVVSREQIKALRRTTQRIQYSVYSRVVKP